MVKQSKDNGRLCIEWSKEQMNSKLGDMEKAQKRLEALDVCLSQKSQEIKQGWDSLAQQSEVLHNLEERIKLVEEEKESLDSWLALE